MRVALLLLSYLLNSSVDAACLVLALPPFQQPVRGWSQNDGCPPATNKRANKGWVNIGISSDTAEFAVNTICTWWQQMGKATYSNRKW
jgi:hypothetical protein